MIYTRYITLLVLIMCFGCSSEEQTTQPQEPNDTSTETRYFPPINSNDWETKSISSLGWNSSQLQPLLDFLEDKNTKSFMLLYNGKIVIEAYFNEHTSSTNWYWASAGKTLTTAITGIAQHEGLININHKVSDYLGTGWTAVPVEKENNITCKNLLSMDSGLDDSVGYSVSDIDLLYKADAGTRWAYHNVYVKLQDVIAQASEQTWSTYFNFKLRDKIGMNGGWLNNNDLNTYWSDTKSMARFGLLISANGVWDEEQIIPEAFLSAATNTSQNMNLAYGYLWWLNGKNSYRLPGSQIEIQGKLIPNAPDDLYAALGKNDQKLYIVPSKNLVIVRMGEVANITNFALSSFDNDLWEKINALTN